MASASSAFQKTIASTSTTPTPKSALQTAISTKRNSLPANKAMRLHKAWIAHQIAARKEGVF